MNTGTTHYATLEVAEHASAEAIRGAYKHLSQRWHPDKNSANLAEAENISGQLNTAYAVLSDPARKAVYDNELRSLRKAPTRIDAPSTKPTQPRPENMARPATPKANDRPTTGIAKGAAWGAVAGAIGFALFAFQSGPKSQFSFDLPSFVFFLVAGAIVGSWGLRR